ncbi:MAG TPA: ribose-5-phosphate isomerase RpiA [Acidobacteriaceae bacterium]|nr:ribose-5-phosphate isomerase RpiA [Acidobacteriaceae bacterium]
MATREEEKAAAARKSIEYVADGMIVGLGTGSTARYVIELLGERVSQGLNIRGIPTSKVSARLAASLKIPLTTLDQVESIDLTIDGADEIAPGLALIKGGGGALLHEKVVASYSQRLLIVADEHKRVARLGHYPLPVEVIQFAAGPVQRELRKMGANPELRAGDDGHPFTTDEGNFLFDCSFGQIENPEELGRTLKSITGVVEHGLFLGLASMAIVAGPSGVQVLTA